MSWLNCTQRPPGYQPPGDGGPGGGGDGDGGCVGNGCDDDGGCGPELYSTCDQYCIGDPTCTSKSFEIDEIPGATGCTFLGSFIEPGANCDGSDRVWTKGSDCGDCGDTECSMWQCPAPPTPPKGKRAFSIPCKKYTMTSSEVYECTQNVNVCPTTTCVGKNGTWYTTQAECEKSSPDCKGIIGDEFPCPFCWECPSPGIGGPCKKTCPQIRNPNTGSCECPDLCGDTEKVCNTTCKRDCWECDDETGKCESSKVSYNNTCTYEGPNGQNDCEAKTECDKECILDCYTCNVPVVEDQPTNPIGCSPISVNCFNSSETCDDYGHFSTMIGCLTDCEQTSNQFSNDDTAKNLVYGYDYVDSVYERNLSNRKYYRPNPSFTPVTRGNLPAPLFRESVHAPIYAVYNMNNDSSMLFSDFAYTNLNNANLEKSLNKDLVKLLNEVKLATGESIKRKILANIRILLISNRLHTLDFGELMSFLQSIKSVQGNYTETRGSLGLPGSHSSEAKALKLAGEKAFPITPDSYQDQIVEKMRLWKTIATDLDKNVPIRLSNGATSNLYYSVGDTIPLDTTGTLTMIPGDLQPIRGANGEFRYMPVAGDYDRGRVLNLEDLQKVCYLLGQQYSFTMDVKTDETLRIDERYGVTNERKDFYMLTLQPSSITDEDRTNSFVANTKATYKYETDKDTRNEWVKFKPWPYMVFYVDADDPIFNYITNDGEISITSTDFVTDLFEDDPNMMRFIRRLPWTVVLIPSDRDENVPYHVISTQKSYGERSIKFKVNADPRRSDKWEAPHLQQNFSYPGNGVIPDQTEINALYYSMDTSNIDNSANYTGGSPTLPRPYFGIRQILSTLKDFKDNWTVTGDKVNWVEVFSKVSRSKMKNLYQECANWEKFRSQAGLGKISSDASVNANYPRVRDVRSNDKTIGDPNYNTYITIEELPEDQRSAEPGPIE